MFLGFTEFLSPSMPHPQVGEAYKATGRCFSVAAGRISFCYGLRGGSRGAPLGVRCRCRMLGHAGMHRASTPGCPAKRPGSLCQQAPAQSSRLLHAPPAGPSISLDTACSSSLSGTHLLQRLLLEGRCGRGLVTAGAPLGCCALWLGRLPGNCRLVSSQRASPRQAHFN